MITKPLEAMLGQRNGSADPQASPESAALLKHSNKRLYLGCCSLPSVGQVYFSLSVHTPCWLQLDDCLCFSRLQDSCCLSQIIYLYIHLNDGEVLNTSTIEVTYFLCIVYQFDVSHQPSRPCWRDLFASVQDCESASSVPTSFLKYQKST